MKVRIKRESLQRELARKNKSQNWLAHKIKISSPYMSQLMTGERSPSPNVRERILAYFEGSSFDDFFIIDQAEV